MQWFWILLMALLAWSTLPVRFADEPDNEPVEGDDNEGDGDDDPNPDENHEDTDLDGVQIEDSDVEVVGPEPKKAERPDTESREKTIKQYGLDPEKVKGMSDEDLLKETIRLDKELAQSGAKSLSGDDKKVEQPKPDAAKPEEKKEPEKPAPLPDRWKSKLDPELYDEAIRKELEDLGEYVERRLAEIRGPVDSLNQSHQHAVLVNTINAFDEQFNSLGEDYKELVGDGSYFKLAEDSPQRAFRGQVAATAQAIFESLRKATGNDNPITFPELVRRAVNAVAGDKVLEISRRSIGKKIDRRKGAVVHRPTKNDRTAPPGRERAAASVREKLKKMGAEVSDVPEDDEVFA